MPDFEIGVLAKAGLGRLQSGQLSRLNQQTETE